MEWVGLHTHTDAEGQVVTAPMPTHVEVGVFIRAFKALYGNGWVQIPVKMTTYEGRNYVGVGNLKKALQYYIKFLQNKTMHIYKGTGTGHDTVEIDSRPGSVHHGQQKPIPLENNQSMRTISYFVLDMEEREKSCCVQGYS